MSRSAVPPPVTQVLEAASGWLPGGLAEVERRLEALAASPGPPLSDDATATLAAGGKRLRPLLVLLCAGPGAPPSAVRAATAVELVHMATLVHDDVLDDAPLRRGRPSILARSGRDRAEAVGDLLFSRAFAEIAADPAGRRQVPLLAAASVRLARGELMQRRDAFDAGVSAERYLERCRLKTASLFECAAILGRDEEGADEALVGYGREIGLAFQLLDDVLDVAGPPERTGKARGTDLLDGTVTMPLIIARRRDTDLAAIDLRGLDGPGAERVCDAIAATGALQEVRADARERVTRAKRLASESVLSGEQRELLGVVADGVVERYS